LGKELEAAKIAVETAVKDPGTGKGALIRKMATETELTLVRCSEILTVLIKEKILKRRKIGRTEGHFPGPKYTADYEKELAKLFDP